MSKLYRKFRLLISNLLGYVYNNSAFLLFFISIIVCNLVLVTFFNEYRLNAIYKLINVVSTILTTLYIFAWSHDTNKKIIRIEELEDQLNKDKSLISIDDLKEDLADLMHEIWANDMQYTNIFSSISSSERDRLYTVYNDLSEFDKVVNRNKADKVINILEYYNLV